MLLLTRLKNKFFRKDNCRQNTIVPAPAIPTKPNLTPILNAVRDDLGDTLFYNGCETTYTRSVRLGVGFSEQIMNSHGDMLHAILLLAYTDLTTTQVVSLLNKANLPICESIRAIHVLRKYTQLEDLERKHDLVMQSENYHALLVLLVEYMDLACWNPKYRYSLSFLQTFGLSERISEVIKKLHALGEFNTPTYNHLVYNPHLLDMVLGAISLQLTFKLSETSPAHHDWYQDLINVTLDKLTKPGFNALCLKL